ncbi:unnamed protein product [Rangifer tarandus platyrhynchus]|uniref:Uncharacterized protein n=1 Tax=Rangifer tarandus platyrhynchus TaxID=3082113 RepID=A0AC59Z2W6_RANTA
MCGTISREHPQEVTSDLGFHTDPEEVEEEEQAAAEKAVTKEAFQCEWTALAPEFTAAQPEIPGWSAVYSTRLQVEGATDSPWISGPPLPLCVLDPDFPVAAAGGAQ